MENDVLLRLVGLMNLIPTLCQLVNIQGRKFRLGDFIKKPTKNQQQKNLFRLAYIYRLISVKLGVMIDSLYSLMSVQITLTFIYGQLFEEAGIYVLSI